MLAIFQSTRPIRGATRPILHLLRSIPISIHAPHTGRDLPAAWESPAASRFQSTRPIRGATDGQTVHSRCRADFNPRAPYGARRCSGFRGFCGAGYFNPRAPYGARHNRLSDNMLCNNISIHAPHTGRDDSGPGWTTTGLHFNPRAPYGARQAVNSETVVHREISIPAPHTGRDGPAYLLRVLAAAFQSTRPIRGATYTSLS